MAQTELTILNPQQFEVTCAVQPRGTEVIETKQLDPITGKWIVPGPGPEGLWISFHRTADGDFLASALLPEGTMIAQLLLDTEIGLVFKQNPQEKLTLENGLDRIVVASYELQHEIAISRNTLEPAGKPGSSVVAEQQPTEDVSLWIHFALEDGTLLSTFVADDSVAIVAIEGKEHYVVGTS